MAHIPCISCLYISQLAKSHDCDQALYLNLSLELGFLGTVFNIVLFEVQTHEIHIGYDRVGYSDDNCR